MWRNTGVGGAWTRAGTLIIVALTARLMKSTIAFTDSTPQDSHFVIPRYSTGEDIITIIKEKGRDWPRIGRSRVRSHMESGGGNLYSDIPMWMASGFRPGKIGTCRRAPVVCGRRWHEAGRHAFAIVGMGSKRIGSVPGIVRARPRKRPHATGVALGDTPSWQFPDRRSGRRGYCRRSHDEALCASHASTRRAGDIVHTSTIRKSIIGLSPDQGNPPVRGWEERKVALRRTCVALYQWHYTNANLSREDTVFRADCKDWTVVSKPLGGIFPSEHTWRRV